MPALTIGGYLIAPHVSQYAAGASARLRSMGCTPTSGANGLNTVTGRRLSGDNVLAKVARSEETDPNTPGWSLNDLDKAMARLGVGFEIRSGSGRIGVRAAWAAHLTVVMQGDSDQFSNATCSGAFNGDHAITVYPCRKLISGVWHRWVGDPICGTGRWEKESEVWQYGEKLNPRIRFGVFTKPVGRVVAPPDTSTVTHRALFASGARVKIYKLDSLGRIVRLPSGAYYTIEVWDNPASSAPCTEPVRRRTADGASSAITVRMTKGHFVGKTIAANSDGVTIKEG